MSRVITSDTTLFGKLDLSLFCAPLSPWHHRQCVLTRIQRFVPFICKRCYINFQLVHNTSLAAVIPEVNALDYPLLRNSEKDLKIESQLYILHCGLIHLDSSPSTPPPLSQDQPHDYLILEITALHCHLLHSLAPHLNKNHIQSI